RERKEDILPLFKFFMDHFNKQFKKSFFHISPKAEEVILSYPWFGNIRELRNAVERIILLEKGDTILEKHLNFLLEKERQVEGEEKFKPFLPPQGVVWDEIEKQYILEALKMKKGNKLQAAKMLGISRSALLYRMAKYGLK
ncbi:MAG: helix-turn-helix domain-containing protein, partial [Thermodesulfobacteriota bacterium]